MLIGNGLDFYFTELMGSSQHTFVARIARAEGARVELRDEVTVKFRTRDHLRLRSL